MSILWFALVAAVSMVGLMVIATRSVSLRSEDDKDGWKWSLLMIICLIISLVVLLAWNSKARTVILSAEPQRQEAHILMKMSNGERDFYVLQHDDSLQYCYIDESASLVTSVADAHLARATFDDSGYGCVIIEKELQITRHEWGFLRDSKRTTLETVSYEFHIPADDIFVVN